MNHLYRAVIPELYGFRNIGKISVLLIPQL